MFKFITKTSAILQIQALSFNNEEEEDDEDESGSSEEKAEESWRNKEEPV